MSDPSGAKTSSLTRGWIRRWAERRRTVCAGRTASVWCHLRKSRRWRRPRAEWWKTSSDGHMWQCPWWTGQRSLHLAGLKSTAWRTLDTNKEAESSRQTERSVSDFKYMCATNLQTSSCAGNWIWSCCVVRDSEEMTEDKCWQLCPGTPPPG